MLQSDEWHKASKWDRALHQAANRSLDLTIDKLGRQKFQRYLDIYRQASQLAQSRCLPHVTFPCSAEGVPTPEGETDCLWKDSGCGYECLDAIATELNLWDASGPISGGSNGFRFNSTTTTAAVAPPGAAAVTTTTNADTLPGICSQGYQWCEHGDWNEEEDEVLASLPEIPKPDGKCVPRISQCREAWPWPLSPARRQRPPYLLDVPFYIYEDLLWPDDAMVGNVTMEETLALRDSKHSDDWWFVKAALNHPLRTRNPDEGKLFVVPSLFNLVTEWRFKGICYGPICGTAIMNHTDMYLGRSQWFQRHQGQDHILVASHWAAEWNVAKYKNLKKCNVIGMENRKWNHPDRAIMPSLYVGKPCPRQPKQDGFAMIASMYQGPAFQDRQQICKWMKSGHWNDSMPVCGTGEQCPALSQARFGFHARGDTLGSNRLMDTLLSGTVPIFTLQGQYNILPDWIDWKKLSYFADVSSQDAFLASVDAMAADEKAYQEKLKNVLDNRDLFDWRTGIPFDTYMYMLSVHLWPEELNKSKRITSPYSALILPTPTEGGKALFQTFNSTKKIGAWCGGINMGAKSCGECMASTTADIKSLCRGTCHWCNLGAVNDDEDETDDGADDWMHQGGLTNRDKCVHRAQTCRQPPPTFSIWRTHAF